MAEEISKPLCEANKVTMVSSGDGMVGAAKLSGEVLDIMTRLPEAVEKLTGVSISQVTHSCVHFLHISQLIFFCLTHVMSSASTEDSRMYRERIFDCFRILTLASY